MAAAPDAFSPVVDVDGIPDHKTVCDLGVALVVCLAEGRQSPIREDNPPAVRRPGRIPLDDGDVVGGVHFFQQQAGIQPGRPSANDDDSHKVLSASLRFATLVTQATA